jgi:hypothetical protein
VSDAWDDEGFGGEDDWVGGQSLEADLEEDDASALAGFDEELDNAELDEAALGEADDEEP